MCLVIGRDAIIDSGTCCLLLTITVLFFSVTTAQSECAPIYVFKSEKVGDLFGGSVATAGDVNNDGYADLIVGAALNDPDFSFPGRVYVFSGLNGDTLHIFTGEGSGDYFGWSVSSAGDVNNDGYADLIIGARSYSDGGDRVGRVYVFSGLDGDTLYVFNGRATGGHFGNSVSSAGDVNNDGYADMIVGAPFSGSGDGKVGRAYVFSGLDGDTLHILTGEAKGYSFGRSVAFAGDVNNDGYADLIVGDPNNNSGGLLAGKAYVFSGLNGDLLHVFTGESAVNLFGHAVASAGDVNNDSYDDLIVGAPFNDAGGIDGAGRAYVFSGQNGDTLLVFSGAFRDVLGSSVATAGDVNNDGFTDLIVGATGAGRAYAFSGRDGHILHVFTSTVSGIEVRSKFSVASAGDINDDGYTDFIIGTLLTADIFRYGRAYVYSGAPGNCCCVGFTGNIDCDPNSVVDIADLTTLIDHLFIGLQPLCCKEEGNIDGDVEGAVELADLTSLIDHLFISLVPTAACK